MTLYRVDTYASSPSWADITPASGHEPAYPAALASNPVEPAYLLMVADSDTDQHWFTSEDNGATWTDQGETSVDYKGVKLAGPYVVMFGAAIRYSEDSGATVSDKTGDWSDAIGDVDIRGMWVAL